MAYTVTWADPDLPSDYEVAVNGLGLFKNGEARTLTEADEYLYWAEQNGQLVGDMLNGFIVTGSADFTPPAQTEEETAPEAPAPQEEAKTEVLAAHDTESEEVN
jgi:hypothetical protein